MGSLASQNCTRGRGVMNCGQTRASMGFYGELPSYGSETCQAGNLQRIVRKALTSTALWGRMGREPVRGAS